MKTSELKNMSAAELKKELLELCRESFKLRMQKATEQLTKSHLLKNVKKNIARVKTILSEKNK
ncbi:MAG: 50S ribosomal protein L29 [Gammaproteobacteria bacterium GWE2_42_36]|nr:MAG: 50S ribosomal protein L29 [Gammaproteobacteria bacterium GWE2_42_36]HCU05602.1 50S ribosomal protein L29 [Coxiellaceae bacterium]